METPEKVTPILSYSPYGTCLSSSYEDKSYTFKITKKRSPWSQEEDKAIITLVNKYGTDNWTLISNEMNKLFKKANKSGKQCRERWHNHLDPTIIKDSWSEEEEKLLLMKQFDLGNKWSEIAKYLPGRTDNSIKNHFYSKLRKYIRKVLKQISKEGLLEYNGIDCNKYNSDRVYVLIKKNKIPYSKINKDTVLNMIIRMEKKNINHNNIGSNANLNFYFEETGRKKGKKYKSKTVMKHKRKFSKSKRTHHNRKRKKLTILVDEDHKSTQPESISPVQMIPYIPITNIVDLRDKIIINNGECSPEFCIEKGIIQIPVSPFIVL